MRHLDEYEPALLPPPPQPEAIPLYVNRPLHTDADIERAALQEAA